MDKRAGAAALSCVVALGCSHTEPRAEAPRVFREYRGEHIRLVTDLGEEEARTSIVEFERVRTAFSKAFFDAAEPPPGRLDVIAFATAQELGEFAPSAVAGFFARSDTGELFATAGPNPIGHASLRHELAHQVSATSLARQPRWVNEGIACYLEALQTEDGGRRFVLGRIDAARMQFLQAHPVTDWQRVLGMGAEHVSAPAEAAYPLENASWLLFHWLHDAHPADLSAYLERLEHGESPATAVAAAMPWLDAKAIAEGIRRHDAGGASCRSHVLAPFWAGPIESRTLGTAELHAIRARLFAGSPRPSRARAAAEVALALAADPGEPDALAVDAALSTRSPQERLEKARIAARLHSGDLRAELLLAEAAAGDERRDAIARALALSPHDADALRLSALDAVSERRDVTGALLRATEAARLAPTDPRNLDVEAMALALNHRCEDAARVEARALEAAPEGTPHETIAFLERRSRDMESGALCTRLFPAAVKQEPPRLRRCKRKQPIDAPRAGAEFEVDVSEDGSVLEIHSTMARNTALAARWESYLRSCTFAPGTADGRPVRAKATVTVTAPR